MRTCHSSFMAKRVRHRHRRARATVTLPRRWLALAMPAVHVPTAAIFASPHLTRCAASAKISVFSESYGRNDLEPIAASQYPGVAQAIMSLGRIVPGARMGGSGASVFAVCESEHAARLADGALPETIAGRAVVALARHPLAAFVHQRALESIARRRGMDERMVNRDTAPFARAKARFPLGSRQVVRHRILIPAFVGSIPTSPAIR